MSDIRIFVPSVPAGELPVDGAHVVPFSSMRSAAALRYIAGHSSGEYIVIYLKTLPLQMGLFAYERMVAIADDTGADMIYADHYKVIDGQRKHHNAV